MRRAPLVTGGLAVLLLGAAASSLVPFRADALRRLSVLHVSWDAALHASSGLDLFDALRLGLMRDALGGVLSLHWWGPLFGLVLAPSFALLGRTLEAATLPSLLAALLVPPAAFLAASRALGDPSRLESAALAALVGAFTLRSPLLLEFSSWIMLEALAGLLAVLALGLLAGRGGAAARRTAFALGAALFLLKYHDGFFLLATAGAAAWLAEDREGRARFTAVARAAWTRGRAAALAALAALAVVVVVARRVLEASGGDELAARLPSVSNVAWGALVAAIVLAAFRGRELRAAWREAPPALHDFALWGLLPAVLWCLDPANVRAWYRQLTQPTDAAWNPAERLSAYASLFARDYTLGAVSCALLLAGLALALVLGGSPGRRLLAAFALWPVLLMSLNRYPAEARFLGVLVPTLFAASAAGLVAGARRLPRPWRTATIVLVALGLGASLASREQVWRAERERRAEYRYRYDAPDEDAAARAIAQAPREGRVALVLPADPPVWPTVRLALRLERPQVAPHDVVVEARGGKGAP
jgi:hypothetical protein